MKSVVKQQVFGQANKPTIYYLTGYGGRINQFKIHIKALARAGFRVVAFEYERSIIENGDPELLISSLKHIVAYVNKDKQTHPVAGIFGVSLGTWLGFNVMIMTDISRGYYLSGGVNIANTIWSNPNLEIAKQAFMANGFTLPDFHKAMKG